jgi:hypothetical protein
MTAVRDLNKGAAVSRITRLVLLTAVAFFAAAPIASASPAKTLKNNLSALWTNVLETPSAQNPFGTGDPTTACWDLGRTVAPFAPLPGVASCTVTTGTKLFVIPSSSECSTFEGNGTTDAVLRMCAENADAQTAPAVSVDGKDVTVAAVETPLLEIVLPADNIFGMPAGTDGLSVAHGWVTLLPPLTPGTHQIVFTVNGNDRMTTTIVVETGP